jgi:hypothetical protein
MNFVKTGLLLALLTGIFVAIGALVGGVPGMLIAFLIALAMNMFSLWQSDKLVLRMYGAEEVDAQSGGQFYEIVRDLAAKAQLPMPRVYIMNNPQPNAFATGRNPQNAAVCASTGLIEAMSPEEIAGVMAHELAHVKNYDTMTMAVAATIGGAVSMLAQLLQFRALFGGNQTATIRWAGSVSSPPSSSPRWPPCWCRWREPLARVPGRQARRHDLRQSAAAILGAAQDRALRARHPQRAGRGGTGHGPPLHHQPYRPGWTAGSPPTPTRRTASPSWRSWRPSWGRARRACRPRPDMPPRPAPPARGARPPTGRAGPGVKPAQVSAAGGRGAQSLRPPFCAQGATIASTCTARAGAA